MGFVEFIINSRVGLNIFILACLIRLWLHSHSSYPVPCTDASFPAFSFNKCSSHHFSSSFSIIFIVLEGQSLSYTSK